MRTRATDGRLRIGRMVAAIAGAALALWLLRGETAGAEFLASCVVDHHSTYDTRGVQFFELRCGQANGAFAVSVDKDLPIAQWLAKQDKARVSLALGGKE
jgi:hypothetical protein